MLLSLEEGYIHPTVDLFNALFSAHPIPFVCAFFPAVSCLIQTHPFYIGLLLHFCVFQLLSYPRVYVCSSTHRRFISC